MKSIIALSLILATVEICISTATKVLYVLPDNSTNISCPSQPCATLSQYLLDNGTLPVVSNVEYHFLPGEHHVPANMVLQNLHNFSIVGTVSKSSVLFGCPQLYVIRVINSHFVIIKNVIFKHCSFLPVNKKELTNLQMFCCVSCKIQNVTFLQYGFTGLNLLGESYLHNIKIEIISSSQLCCQIILLKYTLCSSWDSYKHHMHDVMINHLVIGNYMNIDTKLHIHFELTTYHVSILLNNSIFYNTTQTAMFIQGRCSTTPKLITVANCTFKSITATPAITILLSPVDKSISFVNCKFHVNNELIVIRVEQRSIIGCKMHYRNETALLNTSNIRFISSEFINNSLRLITVEKRVTTLSKVNVLFQNLNIFNNHVNSDYIFNLISVTKVNIYINFHRNQQYLFPL